MLLLLPVFLTGCGSTAPRHGTPVAVWKPSPSAPGAAPIKGGYLNDGPGDSPPANLDAIPDAKPRVEPLNQGANRPYNVLGKSYTPYTRLVPYRETGVASWYGRRYHGKKTSIGEVYDMYAMTAAHTTLPIPSYARVTNLKNNKSVVVRINDRGPFHSDRLIDLSYTAAHKLGVLAGGSARVEVEAIDPANYSSLAASTQKPDDLPAASPPAGRPFVPDVPSNGHYVQLGAFSVQENAEHFRGRLKVELAQFADKLQIHPADGLFRVRAGPYQTMAEAGQVAAEIENALNIKAVLITR